MTNNMDKYTKQISEDIPEDLRQERAIITKVDKKISKILQEKRFSRNNERNS